MFNAICENGKAQAANFPFCTIEPNVGVVAVPDPRLDKLSAITKSRKIVPTSIEFVDIAGLVKGASKGEGLGNQFLANIRECDSIVQVVRCFEDQDVVHVAGKVDPIEDTDVINFLDQDSLIDLVGNLGNNNLFLATFQILNLCPRTDHHAPLARLIGLANLIASLDNRSCREIRSR